MPNVDTTTPQESRGSVGLLRYRISSKAGAKRIRVTEKTAMQTNPKTIMGTAGSGRGDERGTLGEHE